MANSFQEYYQFNTKIALDRTVLQRIEKKSGERPATRLRKPMFIWSIMHQKGLRVLLPPMLPHQLDLISSIISSLKHLTEPLIREVGWTKPCPFMRGKPEVHSVTHAHGTSLYLPTGKKTSDTNVSKAQRRSSSTRI